MKKILTLVSCLALGVGCARFTTKQTDRSSYNEQGQPIRTITTQASASTLFQAKSGLSRFKAMQTDKTQSAVVGELNQESTGTNTAAIVHDLTEAVKVLQSK